MKANNFQSFAVGALIALTAVACDKRVYREHPGDVSLSDVLQVKAPHEISVASVEQALANASADCSSVFPLLSDGRANFGNFSFPSDKDPCLVDPSSLASGDYRLVDIFSQILRPEDDLKLNLSQHLPVPGVLDAANTAYFFSDRDWGQSVQPELHINLNLPVVIVVEDEVLSFEEMRNHVSVFSSTNETAPYHVEFSVGPSSKGNRFYEFFSTGQRSSGASPVYSGVANWETYRVLDPETLQITYRKGDRKIEGRLAFMNGGRDDVYVVSEYSTLEESGNRYLVQLVHRYTL